MRINLKIGDLLVAHPHWNDSQEVHCLTACSPSQIIGLCVNKPLHTSVDELLCQSGYMPTGVYDVCYEGGDINPGALIMLHSNEWYSANTMVVTRELSISSDQVMLDKLASGNLPDQFRCTLGISVWTVPQMGRELSGPRPQWIVVNQPSLALTLADPLTQYEQVIAQYVDSESSKLMAI